MIRLYRNQLILFLILIQTSVFSQEYYFQDYKPFDRAIPSPEEFLGYPIGEYHTRHDLVVAYMYTLAELSDKATVAVYGKTHENRKLLLLQIGSPSHLENLEDIRSQHLAVVDPESESGDFKDLPLFVNLAYGVHGNEPSSTEAAMLMAYTLVASESPLVKSFLENMIVFLDPTINPDGRDRHTNWVNRYRGQSPIADKYDIEHNESWPGGRTNHYWFDLNRDLLLAVNPESQGRLKWYHDWYPNIVTDFHEMGSNSTYFFEPKNRSAAQNPITPAENRDVLNKLFAEQFASDLDQIGSFYFSGEVFDATYPGYGSTYMDLHGSLALLFEQASSRGHIHETETGEITFPFTIRNQYVSSMATLKASLKNKDLLYEYQSKFYENALKKAGESKIKGYVFGDSFDKNRNRAFLEVLLRHHIEVYPISDDLGTQEEHFKAGSAFFVPTAQKQYYMVQSLFETYNKYRDSVFYDTSAWSMVNFYNLKYKPLTKLPTTDERITAETIMKDPKVVKRSDYAYLISYDDYYAPALLYALQNRGLVVKVAEKPFSMIIEGEELAFHRGTLMVPVHDQNGLEADTIHKWVDEKSREFGVPAFAVSGGKTVKGHGLGSRSFKTLNKANAMMMVEGSVNSYEAGEVWHLFENRMKMPLTKVPERRFYLTDIYRYNVIIMVSGSYRWLNKKEKDRLIKWVADGNTLITIARGSEWAVKQKLANEKLITVGTDSVTPAERNNYEQATGTIKKQNMGGAIFGIDLDITHPLGYGYLERKVPVYKNNRVWLAPSQNRFSTVGKYLNRPHIDGYISPENLDIMKRAASVLVSKRGKGRIILFADNPNFRGAWYGTNKLFMNAVHFGQLINVPQ